MSSDLGVASKTAAFVRRQPEQVPVQLFKVCSRATLLSMMLYDNLRRQSNNMII